MQEGLATYFEAPVDGGWAGIGANPVGEGGNDTASAIAGTRAATDRHAEACVLLRIRCTP